jgi:hypothetical protein
VKAAPSAAWPRKGRITYPSGQTALLAPSAGLILLMDCLSRRPLERGGEEASAGGAGSRPGIQMAKWRVHKFNHPAIPRITSR